MASTCQSVAERRRHPRYEVADVAAVVGQRRLGQIVEMSLGGLSFTYVSMSPRDEGPVDLGIVFGPNGHYLEKLPTRLVSESVLSRSASPHPIFVYRRSLEFVGLSEEQKERLSRFIRTHATASGS